MVLYFILLWALSDPLVGESTVDWPLVGLLNQLSMGTLLLLTMKQRFFSKIFTSTATPGNPQ